MMITLNPLLGKALGISGGAPIDRECSRAVSSCQNRTDLARRAAASARRVREWRLGFRARQFRSSPFPLRVPQYLSRAPVSTPCLLEPDVRFSLIRLSDNLRPEAFKTLSRSPLFDLPHQARLAALGLLALRSSLR